MLQSSEAFLAFAFFFFPRRSRHTSSLRDWSSDVCSSDLLPETSDPLPPPEPEHGEPKVSLAEEARITPIGSFPTGLAASRLRRLRGTARDFDGAGNDRQAKRTRASGSVVMPDRERRSGRS